MKKFVICQKQNKKERSTIHYFDSFLWRLLVDEVRVGLDVDDRFLVWDHDSLLTLNIEEYNVGLPKHGRVMVSKEICFWLLQIHEVYVVIIPGFGEVIFDFEQSLD